jgi:Uncharacterised protein conserved in bacteria (DUF2336)
MVLPRAGTAADGYRIMERQILLGVDGLAELGSRTGADMRSTLLRVLTDLYVHRLSHTPDEERHYTELALRLLDVVDVPTRTAVAKRFAAYLSPPLRVLQKLAGDLPEVTAHLRSHPLLQPSARLDLPAPPSAAFAIGGSPASSREPRRHQDAARVIDPGVSDELNELFFAANAEERRLVLLNLHIIAPIAAGRLRIQRDPSVSEHLEAAALAGRIDVFAHELARALHIPQRQARRMTHDDLGDPVVVAAKVLGMPRQALYRVLMFVNPSVGHSVERVRALAALHDEMPQPAAEGMVVIWQGLQQREQSRPVHQPVAWDDETRRSARVASPMQRLHFGTRNTARRNAS